MFVSYIVVRIIDSLLVILNGYIIRIGAENRLKPMVSDQKPIPESSC